MHLHTGHYSPLLRPLPQFPNFFPSRDFFLAKNTKPKPHKTNLKRERMREIEIFAFSCPDSGGLEYYCLRDCVYLCLSGWFRSKSRFVNHRVILFVQNSNKSHQRIQATLRSFLIYWRGTEKGHRRGGGDCGPGLPVCITSARSPGWKRWATARQRF